VLSTGSSRCAERWDLQVCWATLPVKL